MGRLTPSLHQGKGHSKTGSVALRLSSSASILTDLCAELDRWHLVLQGVQPSSSSTSISRARTSAAHNRVGGMCAAGVCSRECEVLSVSACTRNPHLKGPVVVPHTAYSTLSDVCMDVWTPHTPGSSIHHFIHPYYIKNCCYYCSMLIMGAHTAGPTRGGYVW